jgi:hypothetical protein
MHKLISIIFLFLVGGFFSQSIENVDFRAEGKTIVVTYDFFHSKADTAINVELVFKDQKGAVVTPKTISGHLKNVKPGESKRIVWDILADTVSLSGKYKAEVSIFVVKPFSGYYIPITTISKRTGTRISIRLGADSPKTGLSLIVTGGTINGIRFTGNIVPGSLVENIKDGEKVAVEIFYAENGIWAKTPLKKMLKVTQ